MASGFYECQAFMSQQVDQSIERQSTRKIALGTILGYVFLAVTIVSGLLFTPLIKSEIGSEMYGVYTLALSILNLFLLDFGLGTSINAYVSKYRAEHKIEDEDKFLSATLKIYLFLDFLLLLAFVAAYFLIEYVYVGLSAEEIPVLKNVFLILTGFSLLTFPGSVFSGILNAYEEFASVKGISIIHRVVYIVLTFLALYFDMGVYAVVLAYAISSLVNAVSLMFVVRFKLKKRIRIFSKTSIADIKQIASFSIYAFIVSLASRLIFSIVPSILGVVSDSVNIAVFGVCSSLEGYVYSFGGVMSGLFMPKIARLKGKGDEPIKAEALQKLALKVGKIQLAFILLIFVGFVSVGKQFIDFWLDYDPNYSPVYLGTILLIAYQLVNVPETIFYTAMQSRKEFIRPLSFSALGVSLLNVGLVFLFGYFFGALGACISIMLSHTVELVVYNFLYKRALKVSISGFFKSVYLGFIPAAFVSMTIGLVLSNLLPFSTPIVFFASGCGCVLSYLLLVWIGFGVKDTAIFLRKTHIADIGVALRNGVSRAFGLFFGSKCRAIVTSLFIVMIVSVITASAVGSALYPDITYISSTEDFYKIAADLNGHYILSGGSVMNLPDDWAPVGTEQRPFTGTIDGNGVTLNGYDEEKRFVTGDDGQSYYGLIGYNCGTIENISFYCQGFSLSDEDVLNADEVVFGLAAAYNLGTLNNVYVEYGGGDMIVELTSDKVSIGAVAGISEGAISKCGTTRSLNGASFAGKDLAFGLVGRSNGGSITESFCDAVNLMVDSLEVPQSAAIGGIVGNANATAISNCYSDVFFRHQMGVPIFGGIVGVGNSVSISNSYSSWGLIYGNGIPVLGGIVGSVSNGSVASCVSAAKSQFHSDIASSVGLICGLSNNTEFSGNCYLGINAFINSTGGDYCDANSLSLSELGWDQSIWNMENGEPSLI